jgi:dihydrofolate synthase / folylpolyglutamate synthase
VIDDSTEATPVASYRQAEDFITGLIMGPPSPAPGSTPEDIRQRAVERIQRLKAFLTFLGNPHLKYRTIHIGGTSGKGSTTSMVASILTASGFRTGSHVSPYLQVSTEKLLIDGRPASAARYLELVQTMQRAIEDWQALGNPIPTYGEVWVAMTFVYFAEENVDIAVIEVGAGGRFDLTNVVQPDVAAITSIGFDHTVTLGETLPEIAWHKAGILKPGAQALTGVVIPEALAVIQAEAISIGVDLHLVHHGISYTDVRSGRDGTSFQDTYSGVRFEVPLSGEFQAANASLAIAICRSLDEPQIDTGTIARGLKASRFPGRMEVVQESPLVLLDGAHNPEKISHLRQNIPSITGDRNIILVFGVLESKNYVEMWAELAPLVSTLVATAPEVLAKPPVQASEIAALAADTIKVVTAEHPLDAIAVALNLAGPKDAVVVTGSLYLVGNIREYWYPSELILEQGNSWPDANLG